MMTHPSSPAPLPAVTPLPAGNDGSAVTEPDGALPFNQLLLGAQQSVTTPPKPATAKAAAGNDHLLPNHRAQATASSPEAERAALAEQLAQWLAQWLAAHQNGQPVAGKTATAVGLPQPSAASVAASGALASDARAAAGNLAGLPAALATALNHIAAHPVEANDDLRAAVGQLLDRASNPRPDPPAEQFAQRVAALLAQGKASDLPQTLARLAPNDQASGLAQALTALTAAISDQASGLAQALTALTAAINAKDRAALPEAIAQWLQPLGVEKIAARGNTAAADTPQTPWQKLLAQWLGHRPAETPAATSPLAAGAQAAPNKKVSLADDLLRTPLENTANSGTSEPQPAATPLPLGRLVAATANPAKEPLIALSGVGHGGEATLPVQGAPATPRPPSETIQTPLAQTAQWAAETAERIVWHAGRAHEKVELQLTPPHLGKIEVTLQLAHDQLTAQFVTASQATRDALDQAMPRLRELLQQAGIQLGQTFVANQGSGDDRQPPQPQQGSPAPWSKEREAAPAVGAAEDRSGARRTMHDGLEAWA